MYTLFTYDEQWRMTTALHETIDGRPQPNEHSSYQDNGITQVTYEWQSPEADIRDEDGWMRTQRTNTFDDTG